MVLYLGLGRSMGLNLGQGPAMVRVAPWLMAGRGRGEKKQPMHQKEHGLFE